MKKLILTLTLVAAVVSAYGQGSVAFSNGTLSRLSTQNAAGGPAAQVPVNFAGGITYGIFYTASATQPLPVDLPLFAGTLGRNSTTGLGLIAGANGVSTLPNVSLGAETSPGQLNIWMMIGAWSSEFATPALAKVAFDDGTIDGRGIAYGFSGIRNLNALGNPALSGAAIWQSATGTNPKLINAFAIPVSFKVIPEPSMFALAGLGAAAMLIFRRRS